MREDIENIESFLKENPSSNLEDKKDKLPKNDLLQSISQNQNKMSEYYNISSNQKPEKKSKYIIRKKDFDDNSALLSEKEGLKLVLNVIQKDLDLDEETLEEVYEPFINNEDMTKRVIKEDTSRCTLMFMFYIISPIFAIIHLVAIYESLLMMKILLQVLENSLLSLYKSWTLNAEEISKFSINDFNNKYNYYFMFFDDARKDSFDFNLMLFTAFLGDIVLQSRGFRVSTFIFALINIGAIFLVMSFSFFDYNIKDNTFSFFKLLYLILGYLLLLVGAGASALLSQQIIIDSNYKYNDYIKKLNEKSLELMEIQKQKKEAEREELEKVKLPTLSNMITSQEENNENDKNIFPLKTSKSEYIKASITPIITGNKKDEELDIKNIKNDMKQVDSKKLALSRSKTTLITRGDEMINEHSKKIKEKELRKKEREKAKANVKKKSRFDSFFMVCITTIIGYFMKYLINLIISEKRNLNIGKYITLTNCGNDTNCFNNIIRDNNLSFTDKNLFNDLISNIYDDGQNSFYIIIFIYGGCIVSSILLYSFFVCIFDKREISQDEEIQKNKYRVCEICGYIIYSQNIIFDPYPPKCQCLRLSCETFINCINMAVCTIGKCKCCNTCNCDDELIIKNQAKNDEEFKYLMEQQNKICRNCCLEYKEEDYLKNQQFFCYCYQAQRKHYWVNKFLTNDIQKKLFPFMGEYFILQILICAFEKQYLQQFEDNIEIKSNSNSTNFTNNINLINFNNFGNNSNNNSISNDSNNFLLNDLYSFLTFILTFFLFFYFTLSFAKIDDFLTIKKDKEEKAELDINRLSLGILDGTHGVLIFDGLFTLIFSSLYLNDSENPIFDNKNFLLVPILMNKFYYFTLIFYCISYSEEKRKFELISSSTLISIYIFIINSIVSLIRNYIPLKPLHIIQLVFSCCFPCLLIIFIIFILFYEIFYNQTKCAGKLAILCCYASFIFFFGGFWITPEFIERFESSISEENFDCSADCFCECCFCLFDCCYCLNSLPCCRTLCPEVMCSCCKCCICYDCCECCDCFYCCGNECSCKLC